MSLFTNNLSQCQFMLALRYVHATSPKVVVVTWNRRGMHSHAGAWERGNKHNLNLVPTLLRGNAYLRNEHFITSIFREVKHSGKTNEQPPLWAERILLCPSADLLFLKR